MPPIQDYNIYTANAYKGQESDASTPRVIGSVAAAQATPFGVVVKQDGTLGHTSGNAFGFALREANHEAKLRPSDGTTEYKDTETISVFREGYINVEVTIEAAVAGALANIVDATGEISGGTVAAGETESTNIRFMEAGIVGDIVRARIDIK